MDGSLDEVLLIFTRLQDLAEELHAILICFGGLPSLDELVGFTTSM